MRNLLLSLTALAVLAPGAARADKLVESGTKIGFESPVTYDGVSFKCLGTGLRKKFVVKVYAVAFCLEASKADAVLADAKAKAGAPAEKNQAFFNVLRDSDAAKAVDLRFVHNVGKEKIVEAFEETLQKAMGDKDKDGRAKFLALVDRDVRDGQTLTLTATADGKLTLTIAGHAGSVTDPAIAKAIWNAWIGPDSVTEDLKEDLARRAR